MSIKSRIQDIWWQYTDGIRSLWECRKYNRKKGTESD